MQWGSDIRLNTLRSGGWGETDETELQRRTTDWAFIGRYHAPLNQWKPLFWRELRAE